MVAAIPWNETSLPDIDASLAPHTQARQIKITNALLKRDYKEGKAIRIATTEAKERAARPSTCRSHALSAGKQTTNIREVIEVLHREAGHEGPLDIAFEQRRWTPPVRRTQDKVKLRLSLVTLREQRAKLAQRKRIHDVTCLKPSAPSLADTEP